jgi:hypothetical protein
MDKWIRLSTRSSEDGKEVLFCDINNDIWIGHHIKGTPTTHFVEQSNFDRVKNVKAWMSLPAPLGEEDEKTKISLELDAFEAGYLAGMLIKQMNERLEEEDFLEKIFDRLRNESEVFWREENED